MPLYDYKCECGYEFEEVRTIKERNNVTCSNCGSKPKRVFKTVRFINDVVRVDNKYGEFNPGLGEYITSKSQMKRVAKSKGLEWIGDDPVPKRKREKAVEKVDWNNVYKDLDKAGVKN